jgi:hypothetical protein
MLVSAHYRQFDNCYGDFSHCRKNIININCLKISNSFALAVKQGRKAHRRLAILLVSKARTNKFHICRQCTVGLWWLEIKRTVKICLSYWLN